jgi:hypothetical protein
MEEIKEKLLALDTKTVYLNDISKGEKIYKINNTFYKNSDSYLQGFYRFFLRESKDTTLEYLNEIVSELIIIKKDFNSKNLNKTYLHTNDELRTNDYNYIVQIFHNLKDRFLSILNTYEETYNESVDLIKNSLINSLSTQ